MARQRPPIVHDLPFTYWVFGRPVSTQNADGAKPAGLPRWRGKVATALAEQVETASGRRGMVLVEAPVALRIVWLTLDPADPALPDLDNILKPFIDALNGRVLLDDRQVRRILAEKVSINDPPRTVGDSIPYIQDDERFTETGEVTIVQVGTFTPEYRP